MLGNILYMMRLFCLSSPQDMYAKKEDELLNDLFKEYQKWVRPVETLNGTVQVKFGLAISQLVDVVNIDYFVLKIFHTHAQVCSSRCFILFFDILISRSKNIA